MMKIINFVYSLNRKSFEKSRDGGNTYLSSLILLICISFGFIYNIIYYFFIDNFGSILKLSFISSILTAVVLFFYPGYKYQEDKIAKFSKLQVEILCLLVYIVSFIAYVGSLYLIKGLMENN